MKYTYVVCKNIYLKEFMIEATAQLTHHKLVFFPTVRTLIRFFRRHPQPCFTNILIAFDYYYHDDVLKGVYAIDSLIESKNITFITSDKFSSIFQKIGCDTIDINMRHEQFRKQLRSQLEINAPHNKITKNKFTYMESLVFNDFIGNKHKLKFTDKVTSYYVRSVYNKMGVVNTAIFLHVCNASPDKYIPVRNKRKPVAAIKIENEIRYAF